MADLEKSLKKMAIVLERMVQRVDELDRQIQELKNQNKNGSDSQDVSKGNNLASSFLGSLGGVIAGMGLYNLLMDDAITPEEIARAIGVETNLDLDALPDELDDLEFELEDMPQQSDEEWMSLDDYLASEEDDDFDEEF